MPHNMEYLQIAIDGPVAAGKGDIAARLAKQCRLVYINTGAMYRMLALACIEHGVSCTDAEGVLAILGKSTIDLGIPDASSSKTFLAFLNGQDVTDRILAPDVSEGSSDVAVIPEVRRRMVELQKIMAKGKPVVMEGRDIALRVLPHAQLKIYLTASLEERAKRRFRQWQEKGIAKTLEETIEDTRMRDTQDMTRQTDPLQKLPDAWELDTTGLSQEQVVDRIVEELQKRKLI